MKLLRRKEVEERTGLSRSSIYLAMSQKTFPRPLRVGARAVRWRVDEIDAWVGSRPTATPGAETGRPTW